MLSPLEALQQRRTDTWLVGIDTEEWLEQCQQAIAKFTASSSRDFKCRILLIPSNPWEFLAELMGALIAQCPVWLGNPQWSSEEWQQVLLIAQPDLVCGEAPYLPARTVAPAQQGAPAPGWLMIPTGGSSGQIKFVIHTWATLTAAVQGFQRFFRPDGGPISACCVLPLYHVSGLMQFLRALMTGGQFALPRDRSFDPLFQEFTFDPAAYFLSLVPTQLQRLLQTHSDKLQQFHTILLGGAPASSELLAIARTHKLPIALTYGMTETAAVVSALPPMDFLAGQASAGLSLPHARITICDSEGNTLPAGQTGQIILRAESLSLGYFGQPLVEEHLVTDDLGYLDEQGYLHLVGRSSRKLISGGENVFPEVVEAAILASGLASDAYVLGLPDWEWGEAVAAVYVPQTAGVMVAEIQAAIAPYLSRYQQPKRWLAVKQIPRNPQGKVNGQQLQSWFG